MSLLKYQAQEADPKVAHFTVSELLECFIGLVVSGGGFSSECGEKFYKKAAVALGVDRSRVHAFNLGDMKQLTPEQMAGLDAACFGHTGFTALVASRVKKAL